MPRSSRIVRADFGPLNEFIKGMDNKKARVRVGLFGNKANREKGVLTNPELGAIQEFGTFSGNIPPRSFLRVPIMMNAKEIVDETGKTSKSLIARGDVKGVLRWLGFYCEQFVQEAFDTSGFGKWKPNAPRTIRAKKSSKPLIDTSQLRRAVTSKVVGV